MDGCIKAVYSDFWMQQLRFLRRSVSLYQVISAQKTTAVRMQRSAPTFVVVALTMSLF